MAFDNSQTRRSVLELTAAAAAAAGMAGVATAQDDNESGEAQGTGADNLPIILGGRAEYWYGIAPEEIEGEENPTLQLEAGEEYELVWVNLDGLEHNLTLESQGGEELEASDETETAGEAVSMTVEASEEMSEYYCEYHPESMRGSVELNGGFDPSGSDGDQMGDDHMDEDHMDDNRMGDDRMDDDESGDDGGY